MYDELKNVYLTFAKSKENVIETFDSFFHELLNVIYKIGIKQLRKCIIIWSNIYLSRLKNSWDNTGL